MIKQLCFKLLQIDISKKERSSLQRIIDQYDKTDQTESKIKMINSYFQMKLWEEFIQMSEITETKMKFVTLKVESLELILR